MWPEFSQLDLKLKSVMTAEPSSTNSQAPGHQCGSGPVPGPEGRPGEAAAPSLSWGVTLAMGGSRHSASLLPSHLVPEIFSIGYKSSLTSPNQFHSELRETECVRLQKTKSPESKL